MMNVGGLFWIQKYLCPIQLETSSQVDSLHNPHFAQDYDFAFAFGFNVGKMPKKMELHVNVYMSSSWMSQLGENKAREIGRQARLFMNHRSLDTRFDLKLIYIEYNDDHVPSVRGLKSFKTSRVVAENQNKGTIHMLLTAHKNGGFVIGIAWMNSVCDTDNSWATGITKWTRDVANTAETFVHEIGHNLGMFHDFEKNGKGGKQWPFMPERTYTCGPGKSQGGPDNDIMNYGNPGSQAWSKCSNVDFKKYYTIVYANDAEFCLKELEKAVPDPSSGEVRCGGHTARNCGACPQNHGKHWCNGECQWSNNQCQKKNVYPPHLTTPPNPPVYNCNCNCENWDDACWDRCYTCQEGNSSQTINIDCDCNCENWDEHVGIDVLLVKKANNYDVKLVLCQFSNSNLTQIPNSPPLSSTKAMNA